MIEVAGLSSAAEAGLLIGAVLLEAIVLYVGYGAAEQAFGKRLIKRLKST
jgi:hypothetical protein